MMLPQRARATHTSGEGATRIGLRVAPSRIVLAPFLVLTHNSGAIRTWVMRIRFVPASLSIHFVPASRQIADRVFHWRAFPSAVDAPSALAIARLEPKTIASDTGYLVRSIAGYHP